MPESSIEGPADVRLRQLLSRYLGVQEKTGWQYGLYRLEEFAQDQVEFELDRGGCQDTYRGRRVSSRDVQSDAAPALAANQAEAKLEAVFEVLRSRVARAWEIDEQTPEPEYSVDLGVSAFNAQRDDELGAPDEISAELTGDRVANQLLDLDAENDWSRLRKLVLLAEDTEFTVEESKDLAPRLLELAVQYRDSNDPLDKPAVWSAIRTGASMLHPNEADRLRPLLEPGHPVETSLVAVKMLGRIFEAQPPADVDQYPELAAEVRQITKSLLNRYAISSSQSAAMAQLAIYALAAMASTDTPAIAQVVRGLGQAWFAEQTGRELRELRQYWSEQPTTVGAGPRKLLDQAIRELGAD